MPKVVPHWSFQRYFPPLTHHSVFPPERTIAAVPLTLHTIFPCEESASASAEFQVQAQQPATVAPTPVAALIRKPRGEVSRISRGGYNLQDTLGWPLSEYEEIRTFIIHLARDHLSIRKPWSKQRRDDLKVVFSKAKERYPQLLEYDGDWVVSDFLKIYLKNSSGRGSPL